jgi:hypothetical protein
VGGGGTSLLIGLGILLSVGFIFPLILSPFVESGTYNSDSFIAPLIDFFGSSTNIFHLMPGFQSFMVSQLEAFTYIPNVVAIPLLIISLVLIVYSLIPLV